MKIKAWPALGDKGDSVEIKLFDSAEKAQQQNGLLRLILLKYADEAKALEKKIPDLPKMCLHYNSTGKCGELKKSIMENVFRLNFINDDLLEIKQGIGLNETHFNKHLEENEDRLSNTLKELSQQLLTLLPLNHQIRKRLKGTIDLSLLETLNDVRDQIDSLVYAGFLNDLSLDELRQYPRYLKAIVKRLERLAGDANKDRGLFLQIQPHWDDYKKLKNKEGYSEKVREIRWMLEEFRVSLFAQDLGTAYPVSAKRITKLFVS
jgi:ATP-dependent helicase HrpA